MKKFVSKREREKKIKRNQLIVGLGLTVLMFFSIVGFAFQFGVGIIDQGNSGVEQERITYNGLEFIYNNGFWFFSGFAFRYNPLEVPDIQPTGDSLKEISSYQGKPLYIYSDNQEARSELSVNLGSIVERVRRGCPDDSLEINSECNEQDQLISCGENDSDNFIIIHEGINREIRQDNNCVFITGSLNELPLLADQFLFKILEIR